MYNTHIYNFLVIKFIILHKNTISITFFNLDEKKKDTFNEHNYI